MVKAHPLRMLKQNTGCGYVVIAELWKDTAEGWRDAWQRLDDAVDRHFHKCPICSHSLKSAIS